MSKIYYVAATSESNRALIAMCQITTSFIGLSVQYSLVSRVLMSLLVMAKFCTRGGSGLSKTSSESKYNRGTCGTWRLAFDI